MAAAAASPAPSGPGSAFVSAPTSAPPTMSDPLQTAAANALAPFVALASAAGSPRVAADLISRATAAPGTYFFAELYETANVRRLGGAGGGEDDGEGLDAHRRWFRMLEIFCWGVWADYEREEANLPTLNEAQTTKLKHLTLMTLAHTPSQLTYPALQRALALPAANPTALSHLLTSATYLSLLRAQLDPAAQLVHIGSVAPVRDAAPGSLPALIGLLAAWSGRCADVLADVGGQIAATRAGAEARRRETSEWAETWEGAMGCRDEERAERGAPKAGKKRGSDADGEDEEVGEGAGAGEAEAGRVAGWVGRGLAKGNKRGGKGGGRK